MVERKPNKVLVVVDRPNPNDTEQGYGTAIATLLDNGAFQSTVQGEFPNRGEVRFRKGVEGLLASDSRVVLTDLREDAGYVTDDPRSCAWLCLHEGDFEIQKRWEYCEVLVGDFSTVASRQIETTFKPLTIVFFLDEPAGFLYGPFSVHKTESKDEFARWKGTFISHFEPISTAALPEPFAALLLGEQYATIKAPINAQILDAIIGPTSASGSRQLLQTRNLTLSNAKVADVATDAELEKWLGKALRRVTETPVKHMESLREVQNLLNSKTQLKSDLWGSRVERLSEFHELKALKQNFSSPTDLKKVWEQDTPDRKKFIEDNFDSLIKGSPRFSEYEKKLGELDSELSSIKLEIKEQKKEKSRLLGSNQNASEQSRVLQQQITDKELRLQLLDESIEAEIRQIEEENRELLGELQSQVNAKQEELTALSSELESQRGNKETLQKEVAQFEAQLVLSKDNYTLDLIKHASLSEALAGRKPGMKILPYEGDRQLISLDSVGEIRSHVFDHGQKAFDSIGREINEFDLACLITSFLQNFLCVLYGKPGAGKTSLAGILSKLFSSGSNLSQTFVQVQRGWARGSEILGFQNVLTSTREYDSFGLFKSLEYFNHHRNQAFENDMLVVTLDEANLSPLEHYWSDFIGVTDKFEASPVLLRYESQATAGSDTSNIQVPPGMRFLATINTDNTTEPLSDRVLNRATFLRVEPADSMVEETATVDSIQPIRIPSKDLHRAFIADLNLSSLSNEDFFQDLKSGFKFLHIYGRKEKAIKRFLAVVEGVAREFDLPESDALDQALVRYAIPAIRGQQKNYQDQLDELRVELSNRGYSRSTRLLEGIIEKGNETGFYYEGLWAL